MIVAFGDGTERGHCETCRDVYDTSKDADAGWPYCGRCRRNQRGFEEETAARRHNFDAVEMNEAMERHLQQAALCLRTGNEGMRRSHLYEAGVLARSAARWAVAPVVSLPSTLSSQPGVACAQASNMVGLAGRAAS